MKEETSWPLFCMASCGGVWPGDHKNHTQSKQNQVLLMRYYATDLT
jgi:hypothetical protein